MSKSVLSCMTPPGLNPRASTLDLRDTIDFWNFESVARALGPEVDRTILAFNDPGCPIDPSDRNDILDDLIGLYLVALQVFFVSVAAARGKKKHQVIGLGPMHPCGDAKVSLLNDLANTWKHCNEWDLEKMTGRDRRTSAVFDKVGKTTLWESTIAVLENEVLDYSALEDVLVAWRDAVDDLKT